MNAALWLDGCQVMIFTYVLRDFVERFVGVFYGRYRQGKRTYFIP